MRNEKTIAVVLSLSMVAGFAGCSKKKEPVRYDDSKYIHEEETESENEETTEEVVETTRDPDYDFETDNQSRVFTDYVVDNGYGSLVSGYDLSGIMNGGGCVFYLEGKDAQTSFSDMTSSFMGYTVDYSADEDLNEVWVSDKVTASSLFIGTNLSMDMLNLEDYTPEMTIITVYTYDTVADAKQAFTNNIDTYKDNGCDMDQLESPVYSLKGDEGQFIINLTGSDLVAIMDKSNMFTISDMRSSSDSGQHMVTAIYLKGDSIYDVSLFINDVDAFAYKGIFTNLGLYDPFDVECPETLLNAVIEGYDQWN